MDEIVNKVAESSLITLNLEDFYPKEDIIVFDLKDYLFMGLILKEKDFRGALKNIDLENYRDKIVAVHCSADAIIPIWAYMLIASQLQGVAKDIQFATKEQLMEKLLVSNISQLNIEKYIDKRVVIKGCGDLPIKEAAYIEITKVLRPVVKSIMYGEPCSTVPVYKKK